MTDLCLACQEAAHQCETFDTCDNGCEHSGCPWAALTKAEAALRGLVDELLSFVDPSNWDAEGMPCDGERYEAWAEATDTVLHIAEEYQKHPALAGKQTGAEG